MIISIQCEESTSLKSITYHKKIEDYTGDVFAIFQNNEEYLYRKVHIKDFSHLINNQFISIGAAFHNHIKRNYTGQKVTSQKENNNA